MSEWKEYKLGELINTNTQSITKDYPFKTIQYLDTGSITCGKIDSFQEFQIEQAPSRAKRLVNENNIVYSTVRPIQRHYGFIIKPPENLVVSTGFAVIETNDNLADPLFIYHFLSSKEIVETLDSIADGSTSAYPSLKPSDIESLDILLPPLPEQKAIASVLSSLDEKIDLLQRQNKTLEAMAETLFRKWFVEEADESWEYLELGNTIETTSGGTPSRANMEYYNNGNISWVKSKELTGSFILDTEEKITEEAVKNSSAKLLPKHSVLIAMYGATVGEYGIIIRDMTCNQAICALIPNSKYPFTFLLHYIKNNQEEIKNMAVGSAQQNISQVLIKKMLLPNCWDKIAKYDLAVQSNYSKIEANKKQILCLETLRNTLLPKLMSGEVRVNIK